MTDESDKRGTYEVYIDVRHHPRHLDDFEKRERTAAKLVDTGDHLGMVAAMLRGFADELEGRAVEHEYDPERGTYWVKLGGKLVEVAPVEGRDRVAKNIEARIEALEKYGVEFGRYNNGDVVELLRELQ